MDAGKIKVNVWVIFANVYQRALFSYIWSKLLRKISDLKTLCLMQSSGFKRLPPTD